MALWPFRRKSGRKRPRSGAALSDAEGPPARSQTDGIVTRAASKKKQRTEPTKLQRRPRAYSFSPGRQDDLGLEGRRQSLDRAGSRTHRRDQVEHHGGDASPTLHHDQGGRHPSRRKTSRRKKEDRARAAEIKAMSTYDPVRPAADAWTAGRPMKKESKRAGSIPNFGGHPSSDVSLPIPGSIHSSLSSDSEGNTFKVSTLDSLAPRPTLRYAYGTRWSSSRASARADSASQKRPLGEKEPIPEEMMKQHKRVDELADGMNASDLREMMEREDRRREKRRQREKERAERRLARQAEQQRALEAEARKSGTPPPENLERGVVGRELVGLGLDPASAVVTTTERRDSVASEPMPDAGDINDTDMDQPPGVQPGSPHSLEATPRLEPLTILEADELTESEQPMPQESATSLSPSSRLAGILRSKKSRSKSTLASDRDKTISPPPEAIDEEGAAQHESWGSERRGRFSLTSFLRWGGNARRSSGGPPSFSNTSREEMYAAGANQTPAQALARLQGEDLSRSLESSSGVYLARKPSASTPLRTRSRFREDLPDFLMSPPDSRVQSPEAAEPPLPSVNEHKPDEMGTQPIPIPTPRGNAFGRMNTSMSPEPQPSISLASIDSEGSWLSGRVGRRRSAIREIIARANRMEQHHTIDSSANSTQEDLAITDDDYMARLAPQRNSGILLGGRRSEDGRPSSDEEDFARDRNSEARWGAVGARPHLVHGHKHDRTTMQSHEGLLDIESEDEEESESPITPSAAHEDADVQRATSVNLGSKGHARNFSAGSAKLLDINPRDSAETRDGESRVGEHLA